jgi:hypothetical protein
MTVAKVSWLDAFPFQRMATAVDALVEGWQELARHPTTGFNHATHEPDLTLVLASYLRDVLQHTRKLVGHWSAEDNYGDIDYSTCTIFKRTRTDIGYHWNDTQNYSIVFEFKKLDRRKRSRKHYYGEEGMQRFVSGSYSKNQPLALMAGILVDDWNECVDPLKKELQEESVVQSLKMQKKGSLVLHAPSAFSPAATFDTEHARPAGKAPPHGTILISHIFLPFGYKKPVKVKKPKAAPLSAANISVLAK